MLMWYPWSGISCIYPNGVFFTTSQHKSMSCKFEISIIRIHQNLESSKRWNHLSKFAQIFIVLCSFDFFCINWKSYVGLICIHLKAALKFWESPNKSIAFTRNYTQALKLQKVLIVFWKASQSALCALWMRSVLVLLWREGLRIHGCTIFISRMDRITYHIGDHTLSYFKVKR